MIPHPQIVFGAFMFAVVAMSGWIFWDLPLWSRPATFFSVTVVPDFRSSPEAAGVLRGYRTEILAHMAIAFALVMAGAVRREAVFLVFSVLWLVVGPLVAISRGHAKAMPHAVAHSTIREASLAPRQHASAGRMAAATDTVRDSAIERSVYFGALGADSRSLPGALGHRRPAERLVGANSDGRLRTFVFGAGLVALISLLGVRNFARGASNPGSASRSRERSIPAIASRWLLIGVEFFMAAMFSLVALLPLTGSPGLAPMLIMAGGVIACLVLLVRWQSQGLAAHAAMAHPGDGTPDACWKLGLFYFNPDDTALFVEKRIGIGYTINFARGTGVGDLVLILLLPLGLGVLATVHR